MAVDEEVNPYTELVKERARAREGALENSMFVAAKKNPDTHAKVLDLAKKTDLPTDIVENKFDRVQEKYDQSTMDYRGLIKRTPKFAKWLENPDNAAVARDDMEGLKTLEDTVNDHFLMDSLASGMNSLYSNVAKLPALAYDLYFAPANILRQARGEDQIQSPKGLRDNVVAEHFAKQAEALKTPEMDMSIFDEMDQGNWNRAGKAILAQVMANAPQQAAIITGTLTGLGIPTLAGMGALTAADVNAESQAQVGEPGQMATPLSALSNALTQGTIETTFESLGTFGILNKWGKSIAKNYGKAAWHEVAKDISKTLVHSVAGEANEEFQTSWAQELTDSLTMGHEFKPSEAFKRAINAGIIGGASGGGMTTPAAIASGVASGAQFRKATQAKDFYTSMGKGAEATKLRQRLPEAQRQYVEQLVKDSPVENIHISPEAFNTFFQGGNRNAVVVAGELGITAEYNEAQDTGADMKIPLAVWVDKFAGTPEYGGLANDIKFSPDDMSINEVKAAKELLDEQLKAADQEAQSEASAPEGQSLAEEQSAKFVEGLSQQLEASSTVYNKQDVKKVASLVEENLKVRSEIRGQTPEEILAAEGGLEIRGADQPTQVEAGASVLNQSKRIETELQSEVNIPESIAVQEIQPDVSIENLSAKDLRSGALKAAQKEIPRGPVTNTHTGWTVNVSSEGLKKSANYAVRPEQAMALKSVHGLIENGVWLRSESERSGKNVRYHYLYAPFKSDDKIYIAKIGLRETTPVKGKTLNTFYTLHVQEIKSSAGSSTNYTSEAGLLPSGGSVISKADLLNFVNEARETTPLFQDGQTAPRGQIELKKHGALITLFQNQDFSTALHELGHYFLNNMQADVAYLQGQPEASLNAKQKAFLKDADTLLEWFGIESWDQLETKHHEMLAEGFEKYLMEGKAPSQKLQKAFNAFKVWLVSIYKRARNIQVEISPEIKSVFDRMLATEEEIAKAQGAQFAGPLFGRVGAYKMSDAKAEAYDKAFAEAREAASAAVTAKLMKDLQRTRERFYKDKRTEIRKQVEEQVNALRVYRALDTLQKGLIESLDETDQHVPEGARRTSNLKLDKTSLIELFGTETFERIKSLSGPYIYSRKDGMHPGVAAPLLGYSSAPEMIQEILNAPDKQILIEFQVDEQMAELYPDSLTDGTLPQEAIDQAHNDQRAQILRMELEHLLTFSPAVAKDVVRRMVRRVPSDKVIKEQARRIVGSRSVRELRPHIYLLAERKAAKSAGELLAKGDIDGAFEAKQKELLNHELYRAALEAREFINKQIKKFKKLGRSDEDIAKSRDVDLVNAARAILAQFGLGKSDKPADSYLKQMRAYDPERYEVISALVESATERVGFYKDISFDDFVAMSETVNAIYDLSKAANEIEIDGVRRDLEEVRAELESQLGEVVKPGVKPGYEKAVTPWEKTQMLFLGAKASLIRIEHWVRAVDIGEHGPFRKYIFEPVRQATTKYRIEKGKAILALNAIIEEYKGRLTTQVIRADELGYTFRDKAELMMAVLHSGNHSNLDKLLRGRPWGDQSPDGELDPARWNKFIARMQREGVLNKQDYDFAQKIWDLMESMKPEAQRAHKLMYGSYFSEVTANEIVTPFGTYRGGYIPAKVDLYTTEDAAIRAEREAFEKNNNSWKFPTAGRGFTKARVQQYAAPLSLDLSRLAGHIDGVMRFIHIEPRVKEVARIVNHKGFRSRLADLDPTIATHALIPWLQRAATQKVVTPSTSGVGKLLDRAARFLRTTTAMQFMTFNFVNTAQQYTGLSVATAKVKPSHMAGALAIYMKDPKGTTEMIMEKSAFMQSNEGKHIYDAQQAIDRIATNPGTFEKMQDFAKSHTYVLQAATQNQVNTIVWMAAYNQAIEGGVSESQAVSDADAAVRTTQGTSAPEDLAAFEVGSDTHRIFTMFTGYFNMLANLGTSEITRIQRDLGLKKGAGKMLWVYLSVLMVPAVLSAAIVRAAAGGGLDEDDDDSVLDDLMALFFGSQFSTLTAMVPYAGAMLNSTTNHFNKKAYDDRLNLSPVISVLDDVIAAPADIYESIGEDMKRQKVKNVLMTMGVLTSLPIGPLAKPVGYLMDVESGEAEPSGPIDFTRGLITGRRGK